MNSASVKKNKAVERAIAIAGGQAALARMLNKRFGTRYKQQHVRYWLLKGAPLETVPLLIEALNFQISELEFRPDFFGKIRKLNSIAQTLRKS